MASRIAGQRALQLASKNPNSTPYSMALSYVNAAANVQAYPPLRKGIDEACLLQVLVRCKGLFYLNPWFAFVSFGGVMIKFNRDAHRPHPERTSKILVYQHTHKHTHRLLFYPCLSYYSFTDILAWRVESIGPQTSACRVENEGQESGSCSKATSCARNTSEGIFVFSALG